MSMKQTVESFWSKVDRSGGVDACWPWLGSTNNSGYGNVSVEGIACVAHRVAAWLAGLVPSPIAPSDRSDDGFVLHQCDNRPCCNPRHFDVGTFSQNQKEAYARGRRVQAKGDHHANAKLTNSQVEEIRRRYAAGGVTQEDLAYEYGVSQCNVSNIVRGRTYK